jgi:hypothetical protein
MREPDFYRYFFAFRPNRSQRRWLEYLVKYSGQHGRRVPPDHSHLTLCVIAEMLERDPFIVARAKAALDGYPLTSCPFWLGRLRGGPHGAAVHGLGRRGDIKGFYNILVALLAQRDMLPLHRKSGLHEHVTLGYDPCSCEPLVVPCEWIPDELLLIESEVGRGVHNVLARWPLLPPSQGILPFGDPPEPRPLPLAA